MSGWASNPTKRMAASDLFMRTAFALMDSGDENAPPPVISHDGYILKRCDAARPLNAALLPDCVGE
ncbi:hypothetical protein TomMM35A_10470 [Sphingobium sp. TomMM35A]